MFLPESKKFNTFHWLQTHIVKFLPKIMSKNFFSVFSQLHVCIYDVPNVGESCIIVPVEFCH